MALDSGGRCADGGHCVAQLLRSHAKLFAPILKFIWFVDVNPAGILEKSLGLVVGRIETSW